MRWHFVACTVLYMLMISKKVCVCNRTILEGEKTMMSKSPNSVHWWYCILYLQIWFQLHTTITVTFHVYKLISQFYLQNKVLLQIYCFQRFVQHSIKSKNGIACLLNIFPPCHFASILFYSTHLPVLEGTTTPPAHSTSRLPAELTIVLW